MLTLVEWIFATYSCYFIVSILTYIFNIKHIVIWNRRPFLVLVEQFTFFGGFILTYTTIPCIVTESIVSITFPIVLIRTSYSYQYLSDDGFWFNYFFWKRQKLKFRQAVLFIVIFTLLRALMPFTYMTIYESKRIFNDCFNLRSDIIVTLLFSIPTYIIFLILLFIVIQLMYKRIQDKIGLKFELCTGVFASLIIEVLFIVFSTAFKIDPIWNDFIQVANLNFWSIPIPLLFAFRHNLKLKKIRLLGHHYNFNALLVKSRQFYCEENVLFLQAYFTYQEEPSDLLYHDIISLYVEEKSTHELNITEDHRNKALESPAGLDDIYNEIVLLIETNVAPFLSE